MVKRYIACRHVLQAVHDQKKSDMWSIYDTEMKKHNNNMLRTTFVKVMATFEYDPPNRYEVVASRSEAGTSTASSHAKPKQACWSGRTV